MPLDRPEDEHVEIRPGVAGVVRNGAGEILLHRRPASNGWAPPSGTMEPEEDVRSALNRELQEETALSVKIERLVGIYSDPTFQIVRYPDGSSVHFVTTLFDCSVHSGRLQGSDEGSAWGWFAPGALPNPLLPYTRKWIQDTLDEHTEPRVE